MSNKIENAKIASTMLGEEHGCLTADLFLEGKGWGCAYGGYCLDHWYADIESYGSIGGYGALIELMKTVGVSTWEELKGQYIRVEFKNNKIVRIGNLLEDNWFSFVDFFKLAGVKNG